MNTMFLLQISLAGSAAALAMMGLLSASTNWKKGLVLIYFLIVAGTGYAGFVLLLGQPKPIEFSALTSDKEALTLVSSHLVEGEAIYLWTLKEGSAEPTSYRLPWRLEDAKKLQKAKKTAEAVGSPVKVLRSGNPNDGAQSEWTFRVSPPKAPAPKTTS